MKVPLEKFIDKNDLTIIGLTLGATLMGTGIYATIVNTHSVRDAWEISTPIIYSDSYWNTLKTFISAAKYSAPISAVAGFIGSKILKHY